MGFTEFITFLLVGIGLSFDSFAVSVSCGLMKQEIRFREAFRIASFFAFFQAFFPVLGWFIGTGFKELISSVDHWIAFALLLLVGIKMIIEGVKPEDKLQNFDPQKFKVILGLSVATSIDALAVGLSYGFLEMPLLFPAIIIGSVTFVASMLGMLFGKNIPSKRSHQSLVIGGIILTFMGVKILLEHYLA